MAEETKETVAIEEYEIVKAELEKTKEELSQYQKAYKEQVEKYNSLFGLFVNNIDYIVSNTNRKDNQ